MKIAFYNDHPYWGQLANNGGTRTILKSVEILNKMGHEAYVVAHKDKFNWFKHKKPERKITSDTDIVIAVSIADVPLIIKKRKKYRLGYWARPFETWVYSEKKIKKILKSFPGTIMANSQWQIDQMQEWGIKACLIYNGLDFEEWQYDRVPHYFHSREFDLKLIGCLYHKHPRKRWKDCVKLGKKLEEVNKTISIEAQIDGKKTFRLVPLGKKKYLVGEDLVNFYDGCSIWFAPTELEGFHNVPAEANLCDCLIVCSNNPRNGCMDYCNRETAHIYSTLDEAVDMIKNPDYSKVPKMQALLKSKIGTRQKNMEKLIELFKV